jgi:hypothetical protein
MATTTENATGTKIVGALFENNKDANKAVEKLLEKGYLREDIAILVKLSEKEDKKARQKALKEVGYAETDQRYFDKAVEEGKTLVSVTQIPESKTGEVISILVKNGAHYNPDGSRNVRDDVVGMTTGAAVGAAAGAFAGPVGAAIGALAGGAAGAVAGAFMEQSE